MHPVLQRYLQEVEQVGCLLSVLTGSTIWYLWVEGACGPRHCSSLCRSFSKSSAMGNKSTNIWCLGLLVELRQYHSFLMFNCESRIIFCKTLIHLDSSDTSLVDSLPFAWVAVWRLSEGLYSLKWFSPQLSWFTFLAAMWTIIKSQVPLWLSLSSPFSLFLLLGIRTTHMRQIFKVS